MKCLIFGVIFTTAILNQDLYNSRSSNESDSESVTTSQEKINSITSVIKFEKRRTPKFKIC
jgi:hypothetical protein